MTSDQAPPVFVDPNALASALPAGIHYDNGAHGGWNAVQIARFQAERLAESGYQLVYVEHHHQHALNVSGVCDLCGVRVVPQSRERHMVLAMDRIHDAVMADETWEPDDDAVAEVSES